MVHPPPWFPGGARNLRLKDANVEGPEEAVHCCGRARYSEQSLRRPVQERNSNGSNNKNKNKNINDNNNNNNNNNNSSSGRSDRRPTRREVGSRVTSQEDWCNLSGYFMIPLHVRTTLPAVC